MISRASSASTTGAAEIAEAAKYGAPAASTLNRPVRELLAMSAVMAQVGIESSMAGVSLKEFYGQAAKQNYFRDARGNLKDTSEIIGILRQKMKGLGDAEIQTRLTKVFGERGARLAFGLLNVDRGSFEQINEAMDASISLTDKLNMAMEGLNRSADALRGNIRSLAATAFTPALVPLNKMIKGMNDMASAAGAIVDKKGVAEAVSGVSLGSVAVGTIATAALAGAGVYHFKKVLAGVGGFGGLFDSLFGTAAGIAKGKAVQGATGVTPVFVTNFADMPPGGAGGAGGIAVAAGAGGAGYLSAAGKGMAIIGAAGLGYGIGSFLNYLSEQWEVTRNLNRKIEGGIASLFSSNYREAQRIADIQKHPELYNPTLEKIMRGEITASQAMDNPQKSDINLYVYVDRDGNIITKGDHKKGRLVATSNRGSLSPRIVADSLFGAN